MKGIKETIRKNTENRYRKVNKLCLSFEPAISHLKIHPTYTLAQNS